MIQFEKIEILDRRAKVLKYVTKILIIKRIFVFCCNITKKRKGSVQYAIKTKKRNEIKYNKSVVEQNKTAAWHITCSICL